MADREDERFVPTEEFDRVNLARYLDAGAARMKTLDLRSALHAAEREGFDAAARDLENMIGIREARGDTA